MLLASACGSHSSSSGSPGSGVDTTPGPPATHIQHLVVFIQENKTFDVNFGRFCQAPTGSQPTCNQGPACCEAGPDRDPGTGAPPVVLDDAQNGSWSPSHDKACELEEINGGQMDKFISATCGNPGNFAYASDAVIQPLHDLAAQGALADRYFQPVAGMSNGNDMFFARAQWVFDDSQMPQDAVGRDCELFVLAQATYSDTTIGDLLVAQGYGFTFYAEGYQAMKDAALCPVPPLDCPAHLPTYPCVFDPSDDPFEYYPSLRDRAPYIQDYTQLAADLAGGKLPEVSFVKALGYKSEHPGLGSRISDAIVFLTAAVSAIEGSQYADSTLVLVAYDEGGGYFDHVAPPATTDGHPYGTRVPLLALGPFARKGFVSHVTLEHSSIVKFIEYNWLGQQTGQLRGRDQNVANIGSLLDPAATGTAVPDY
jgi:phospholipase C